MSVERWDPEKHASLMESWLEARGQPVARGVLDVYPRNGVLVDGSLLLFLYMTDAPGVAYLDNAVGKPGRSAEQVRESCRKAASALLNVARESGVRVVMATTRHQNLIAGCHDAGFTSADEGLTFLAKPITVKDPK